MAPKIDFDINKVPWEAVARIVAPMLAPIVLAVAWIFLSKSNTTVSKLSTVFALAELTPTVDLNLPSGVVLGSFYVNLKKLEPKLDKILEGYEDLKERLGEQKEDLEEDTLGTLWDWLTFDIRKTKEFKEAQER